MLSGGVGAFCRSLSSTCAIFDHARRYTTDYNAVLQSSPKNVLDRPSPLERRARRHRITRIKREKYPILNSRLRKYFKKNRSIPSPKLNKTSRIIEHLKSNIDLLSIHNDEEENHVDALNETKQMASFYGIFPDLLPKFSPKIYLDVRYPGTKRVYRGNVLHPNETLEFPSIKFSALNQGDMYTLMMVDIDAPLREKDKMHFCNYAAVNIPESNVSGGQVIVQWLPSLPELDSGIHRYCYLLLRQSRTIGQSEIFNPFVKFVRLTDRLFDLGSFVEKNNLKPIGLSFYRSFYNESVSKFMQESDIPEIKYNLKYFQKKKKVDHVQYFFM